MGASSYIEYSRAASMLTPHHAAQGHVAAAASMPAAASPRRLRHWRTKAILVCVLEAAIARERLYQYLAAALNSAEAAADVDAAWHRRDIRDGTGA